MIVLNFSHPLGNEQMAQLSNLMDGVVIQNVKEIKCQADNDQSFVGQAAALVQSVGFSPEQWQRVPFVVVPPGHSVLAACVLSSICGRSGHLPSIVRLKPVAGTTPMRFEPAEVINLQQLRDLSRTMR